MSDELKDALTEFARFALTLKGDEKGEAQTYGMADDVDPLAFLLALNLKLAAKEKAGGKITAPGLPPTTEQHDEFITDDCIQQPEAR